MSGLPALHELSVTVNAPTVVVADPDGEIRPGGIGGVYHADNRVLSQATVTVANPEVRVTRRREVRRDGMAETIVLTCDAAESVSTGVRLELAADLVDIQVPRGGGTSSPLPATVYGDGLDWSKPAGGDTVHVRVTADDATVTPDSLTWRVEIPAAGEVEVSWRLHVDDPGRLVVAPRARMVTAEPPVDDPRLEKLLEQSLADLDGLRLATARMPDAPFLAAGAPWFLTLFGRDSLWAARLALPLGTDLAASTLRALAAYQGTKDDPETYEEPGKIMHELRREALTIGWEDDRTLPPVSYATIDATMLWVILLHEAWRRGLPDDQVRKLLPHLRAAVGWLLDRSDLDGDHLVEYLDTSGHGQINHGWRDSRDGIRFRDGTVATGAIALCEVQGYAYQAALHAAALYDAFQVPGSDRLRRFADGLATAFRERFWVTDERGRYPASALDGDKRPVDALTSSIGHLLGTGLLNQDEIDLVVTRLTSPDMFSGFGLRTVSALDGGYDPSSYHRGSVWPHDTAIVAEGMYAEGRTAAAASLVTGLLAAAEAFDYRLPELFTGDGQPDVTRPVPYPAACRPQAWAAAVGPALARMVSGIGPEELGSTC